MKLENEITNIVKIVCQLNSALNPKMKYILQRLGVSTYHVQSGRTEVYRERKAYFGLTTKMMIEDDLNTIFSFYIPKEYEDRVLKGIAINLNLNIAGFGSIWSEKVSIIGGEKFINKDLNFETFLELSAKTDFIVSKNLVAIDIIVQRGLSSDIIKAVLDWGYCVPCMTYGIGTGFRNTIGILRITIPAEKEIIRVIVPKSESEDVMNHLIDVGKLDKPGKGFISMYSINMGVIDTKIFRGKSLSAASIEQVIAAIDGIKGNDEWRKKENFHIVDVNLERKFLTEISNISIFNDEGYFEQLVEKAMENGASGATTIKGRFISDKEETKDISPSRERSDFVLGESAKDSVISAIVEDEIFSKTANGFIEEKKLIKACTYLG